MLSYSGKVRNMKIVTVIVAFLIFIFAPGFSADAFAWGPATHLELSHTVLNNLPMIPHAVRALIEKYPYDYYYGNIGADIVVGKKYQEELSHCHNWSFGYKLLDDAKSDSQKAFAYGFLSHLAADTVAHNHFIPTKIIKTFTTNMHKHLYWELRFDSFVDKSVWDIPEKIEQAIHLDNDELLSTTLAGTGTALPFPANKTLFSGVLNLHKIDNWHSMIKFMVKVSVWEFHQEDKDRYFNFALDSVMGFLIHEDTAPCTAKDPTGKQNLQLANDTRQKLRSLKKAGQEWDGLYKESLEKVSII